MWRWEKARLRLAGGLQPAWGQSPDTVPKCWVLQRLEEALLPEMKLLDSSSRVKASIVFKLEKYRFFCLESPNPIILYQWQDPKVSAGGWWGGMREKFITRWKVSHFSLQLKSAPTLRYSVYTRRVSATHVPPTPLQKLPPFMGKKVGKAPIWGCIFKASPPKKFVTWNGKEIRNQLCFCHPLIETDEETLKTPILQAVC